jgi:hypothetical protein
MENKILLWLDDIRDPHTQGWLVFSPIELPCKVVWTKSYKEFTNWIVNNGLPDGVCFDHDLGEEHYNLKDDTDCLSWDEYYQRGDRQMTGYDCAKWLINYCIDNKKTLPKYNIQSANPVGKNNIDGLLKNYIKQQA